MADGRCLGFRNKEVQGTCLGMRDKEEKGTCLGMRDMEGGQVGRSMHLGNKFLFYYYRTYRLTGATVVQQLNLVLIFERYEVSTYVCEFDLWVLLIGLLN